MGRVVARFGGGWGLRVAVWCRVALGGFTDFRQRFKVPHSVQSMSHQSRELFGKNFE